MPSSSADSDQYDADLLEDLHKLTNGIKIPSDEEGISKYSYDFETQDALDYIANMRSKALVTYFAGMAPSRNMFLSWATAEWVNKRGLDVEGTRYRGNNCFITTFKTADGRDSALVITGRPPRIKRSSPLFFAWCPEAEDPDFALIMKPVWVNLPSVHSLWERFLGKLFQSLGPILQFPASSRELHYPDARCRILWNVTKVPPECIELWVGDIPVRIEVFFEDFQAFCVRCNQKGHTKETCGQSKEAAQGSRSPTQASERSDIAAGNNQCGPEAARTSKSSSPTCESNGIPSGNYQSRLEEAQASKIPLHSLGELSCIPAERNYRGPVAAESGRIAVGPGESTSNSLGKDRRGTEAPRFGNISTQTWEPTIKFPGKNQRGREAAQTGKTTSQAWELNGNPSGKNKVVQQEPLRSQSPTNSWEPNIPAGRNHRGPEAAQTGKSTPQAWELHGNSSGKNKGVLQEPQRSQFPTDSWEPNIAAGRIHRGPEAAQIGKTTSQAWEPNGDPSGKNKHVEYKSQRSPSPTNSWEPNIPAGRIHRGPEAAQSGKTPSVAWEPKESPSVMKKRGSEASQSGNTTKQAWETNSNSSGKAGKTTRAWEYSRNSSGKNYRGPEVAQSGKIPTQARESSVKPLGKKNHGPEVAHVQSAMIPTPATGSNSVPLGRKQRFWEGVQNGHDQKHSGEARNVPVGLNKSVPVKQRGVHPIPIVAGNQLKSSQIAAKYQVQRVLDYISEVRSKGKPPVQQWRTVTSR